MPFLEVRGLSKSFPSPAGLRHVLKDVMLDVEYGEFISIVGSMGSGKSTLLSLLAGLTVPDAGTVVIDGKPVQACDVPVSAVAGKAITTIEGIGRADALHPLQQAFIDEQAVQCGFCMSGVILTAKALLDRNPRATDADVQQALSGVLCRCFVNARIVKAIRRYADGRRA